MRTAALVVLLALPLLFTFPADGAPQQKATVIGTGNRLSGGIDALFLGPDSELHTELRRLGERIEKRSGLRVVVTRADELDGKVPSASLVVLGRRPHSQDLDALRKYVKEGRGVVGMVGGKIPLPLAEGGEVFDLPRRLDRLDGTGVRFGPDAEAAVLAYEQSARAYLVLLSMLRHAILRGGGVEHLGSVFHPVKARRQDDLVHLTVRTRRDGDVTLSALTVEGEGILPEGPVRPLTLSSFPDPDGTIVRLRWSDGGRLRDEIRLWLPDLVPITQPTLILDGPEDVPIGEPVRTRLTVTGSDDRPIPGCEVTATLGEETVTAKTDPAGTTLLAFPPFREPGGAKLEVEVAGARFRRTLVTTLAAVARPARILLETDRPLYRPGATLRCRAIVVDSVSRAARHDEDVTVAVLDRRGRTIRTFLGRTDRFGAMTFSMPIAVGAVEGDWRVTATAAEAEADATFRVSEIALPPFALDVDLPETELLVGEPIEAVVRAHTFTGEPLVGAAVNAEVPGLCREVRTKIDASGAAHIELLPGPDKGGKRTLRVRVEQAGAVRVRSIACETRAPIAPWIEVLTEPSPLVAGAPGTIRLVLHDERGEVAEGAVAATLDGAALEHPETSSRVHPRADATSLRIEARAKLPSGAEATLDAGLTLTSGYVLEAPESTPPGSMLPVTVLATRRTGPVLVALVREGRLAATASGQLAEGRTEVTLSVPPGIAGPAVLVAHAPGDLDRGVGRRPIRIGVPGLAVRLEPTSENRAPGDSIEIAVQVEDEESRGVPALLSVLGFDPAYLDLAGERKSPLREFVAEGDRVGRLAVLAMVDEFSAVSHLENRARAVAADVLNRALAEQSGPAPVLPWGAPVLLSALRPGGRVDRAFMLLAAGEPPVTARPEGFTGALLPAVVAWKTGPIDGEFFRGHEVLESSRGVRADSIGTAIDDGLDIWLSRHQSPDGSWRPFRFTERCDMPACGDRGDPALHPGTTALALLAFMCAGETHKHGRYKTNVRNGLRFLKAAQREDGFFGDPTGPWGLLNHAMCTLAMNEAYLLTGSPLFKDSARRSLVALVSRQRPDGSFAEAWCREGSLILTAWTSLALKAAQSSKLTEDENVAERIVRWVRGRADPQTRVVPLSDEERTGYPFANSPAPPGPAGMTAMILIQLGGARPRWHGGFRGAPPEGIPDIPPPSSLDDMHGVWWGMIAAFQIGGDTWRRYNAAMQDRVIDAQERAGCTRGSWSAGPSRIGRVAATAFGLMEMAVYYRYARVFGNRGAANGGATVRVRREFPDLLVADLARPTDEEGRARIPLRLPGSLTTWELTVGAWDGRGGYAVGRGKIRSTLPLAVECEVPPRLVKGDEIALPLRVRSRTEAASTVTVEVETSEGLRLENTPPGEVEVPAGGAVAVPIRLRALRTGNGRLRVTVRSEEHADAWERNVEVVSADVPFAVSVPLLAGTAVVPKLPRDAHDLTARVHVSPGPLADMEDALAGLIKRPTGCFEQTAAKLYPALLAFRALEIEGRAYPEVAKRAERHLEEGYQRVLSYEVPGGGFSLWGKKPAEPLYTALGVHLLLDLSERMFVDREVIERATAFLEKQRARRSAAKRIYIGGAIARVRGQVPRGSGAAIIGRGVPYHVALGVVHGSVPRGSERAREILETATFEARHPTLFAGEKRSRVETIALVTQALHLTGGSRERIRAGIAQLRAARGGDGAWGTTRETVVALRTLTEIARERAGAGTLRVVRKGREPQALAFSGDGGVEIDLGAYETGDPVRLEFDGEGEPWARLVVAGATARPPAGDALTIETSWPEKSEAHRGTTGVVKVRNQTARAIHAPIVVVPVPAGWRVDRRETERLAKEAGFERTEVSGGRVAFYLTRLGPGQPARAEIRAFSAYRGRFLAPPARAYPYYEPERATSTRAAAVRID